METTEGFEGHLRDVLHGADDQAAGFSAAQVIAKGRTRRRARTATFSGVALVAAGAVAVVPSTLGGASNHGNAGTFSAAAQAPDPARAATSTSPSPAVFAVPNPPASSPGAPGAPGALGAPGTTTTKAAPPSARTTVEPGTVILGDGYTLKLTSDSLTLAGQAGQVGPLYTDNGNQAPDSISLDQCGRVVAGLYVGSGDAATGTVTVDGKAYATSIVSLAGHPGWSVAYAMLPAFPKTGARVTISVSDAAGHVLASFAPPKTH